MVKKALPIIIIGILLFGLAFTEVFVVNKIITDLDESVGSLMEKYDNNQTDITVLLPELENLKSKWDKQESTLCLMFNHKDMSSITDCISRLTSYTILNDYDDAYTEIRLLKEYTEKNPHIMGCNIHNIL